MSETSAGEREPLSVRLGMRAPSPLVEDIPPYLGVALGDWMQSFVTYAFAKGRQSLFFKLLLRFRIERRTMSAQSEVYSLMAWAQESDPNSLDLIDAFLAYRDVWDGAGAVLEEVLALGGSAWTVAGLDTATPYLARRLGNGVELAGEIAATGGSAEGHLGTAWRAAFGLHPDPSAAWSSAVKALEDVLIPLVVPGQTNPNLGHVIGQLRDAPARWRLDLEMWKGLDSVTKFAEMLCFVWPNPDRHAGTPAYRTPTLQESRSVTLLTVTLVQWVRDGLLARATAGGGG